MQPVQVFIGDLPPPENGRKPFPCVILVPVNGHHEERGETAVIALICCVYNPEPGDAEGAEQDLAILMSGITRVLGACRETPLERRFQLVPDHRGRLLAWEKAETKPKALPSGGHAVALDHEGLGIKGKTMDTGKEGENDSSTP